MRILLVHNRYQQAGGEDSCVRQEAQLLRQHGHEVMVFTYSNVLLKRLPLALTLVYTVVNFWVLRRLRRRLRHRPVAVAHVHNWAYYISPAIITALKAAGVPVVYSVHNYRLVCVGAELYRGGKLCHLCVGKRLPFWGVWHGCFQGSRIKSAWLQGIVSYHHWRGTFKQVDQFIVLSAFSQNLLSKALKIPRSRFLIKAHSVPDPGVGVVEDREDFFLYVGRLARNKGACLLAEVAAQSTHPLVMVGAGPEAEVFPTSLTHVRLIGEQSAAQVVGWMQRCRAILVPSLLYEGLPFVLVEAMACGTPVLVSDNANLKQFVQHEVNGLHVPMGNPTAWVAAMDRLQEADLWGRLCTGARQAYMERYTEAENYQKLHAVYEAVIAANRLHT